MLESVAAGGSARGATKPATSRRHNATQHRAMLFSFTCARGSFQMCTWERIAPEASCDSVNKYPAMWHRHAGPSQAARTLHATLHLGSLSGSLAGSNGGAWGQLSRVHSRHLARSGAQGQCTHTEPMYACCIMLAASSYAWKCASGSSYIH